MDSQYKIPMSHFRERQLRLMFKGLDFEHRDAIDLSEFKNAIKYVQENTKHRAQVFDNLQAIFTAMDEDGDGNVDFQEFTTAINGNGSSINKLSEYDFERLQLKFLEYSIIKKRKFILDTLATNSLDMKYGISLGKKGRSKNVDEIPSSDKDSDLPRYRYLKSLMGIGVTQTIDELSTLTNEIEKKLGAKEPPLPHAVWLEKVVEEFVDDHLKTKETLTESDVRYEQMFKSISKERLDYLDSLKRDSESRQMEERIQEERDYILEGKRIERLWQHPKVKLKEQDLSQLQGLFSEGINSHDCAPERERKPPSTNVKRDIEINRKISKIAFDKIRENSRSLTTSSAAVVSGSMSMSNLGLPRLGPGSGSSKDDGDGDGDGQAGQGQGQGRVNKKSMRQRSKSYKDLKY